MFAKFMPLSLFCQQFLIFDQGFCLATKIFNQKVIIVKWVIFIFLLIIFKQTLFMASKHRLQMDNALPSIQRICTEEQVAHFSHGQTYKQRGLDLKHSITKLKIEALTKIFINKLKANLTSSKPVYFQNPNPSQIDQQKQQIQGINIDKNFESLMLSIDLLMTLLIFFIATFQCFLQNFRDNQANQANVIVIKVISIAFFAIRILIGCIATNYEAGKTYLYLTDIIKKQLIDGHLFLLTFALIMIIVSIIGYQSQTVGIVFFASSILKLFMIRPNIVQLEYVFINSAQRYYIWNLIRILVFNVIFANFVAAFLLSISFINPDDNWISAKLIANNLIETDAPWYKTYIWSYYWACTIMMTMGFGDITPIEFRQAICIAFLELFTCIVLAYNISEVGNIITAMRTPSTELHKKIGILRRMNEDIPVSEQIKSKIQGYLTYEIQIEDEFQFEEHQDIITTLPDQLMKEYFEEANKTIYGNLPFFRFLQGDTMLNLTLAFKGRVYYPSEFILKSRFGSDEVIIIRKGEVGFTYWKPLCKLNGTVIQKIEISCTKKAYLLTTDILSRISNLNYDIKALKYTYGMVLPFEEFMSIIKNSKIDYNFYISLLDKHSCQNNQYDYIKCEHCTTSKNQLFHSYFQCPKLHYIPFKSEVIVRHLYKDKKHKQARYYLQRIFYGKISSTKLRRQLFKPIQKALNVYEAGEQHDEGFEWDLGCNYTNYFYSENIEHLNKLSLKKVNKFRHNPKLRTRINFLDKLNSKQDNDFLQEVFERGSSSSSRIREASILDNI